MKVHTILITSLLCLVTAAQSWAVVLINDDFESYTVNSTPTNPGDGNPNNWFFNGLTSNTTVAGSSPDGVAPNEKLLHVQGTSSSSFGRTFARQDGAGASDLVLTLSFKLQLNSLSGNDYSIRLLDSTLSTNNVPISIRIASNGGVLVLTRTTGPGSGTATNATNPLGAALAADVWYEFTVNANLSTQMFEVGITNLDTGASGSTGSLYFYQNIHTLNQLTFLSTSGTNPGVNWDINDVSATAVPEPSTAMAMLVGAGVLTCGARLQRLFLAKR